MKFLKIFFIVFILAGVSCEKSNTDTAIGNKLEFYLLENYTTVDNTMQIDESSANISTNVLISYDDIISYNSSTYSFKVSPEIIEDLKVSDGFNYHTKAFAVTIDEEIIYTGYFWYAYSSRICDWFVIDPILSNNEMGLKVSMAYPTNEFRTSDIDKRNDTRILRLLKKDGKLVH
jgi:hypothetical protein